MQYVERYLLLRALCLSVWPFRRSPAAERSSLNCPPFSHALCLLAFLPLPTSVSHSCLCLGFTTALHPGRTPNTATNSYPHCARCTCERALQTSRRHAAEIFFAVTRTWETQEARNASSPCSCSAPLSACIRSNAVVTTLARLPDQQRLVTHQQLKLTLVRRTRFIAVGLTRCDVRGLCPSASSSCIDARSGCPPPWGALAVPCRAGAKPLSMAASSGSNAGPGALCRLVPQLACPGEPGGRRAQESGPFPFPSPPVCSPEGGVGEVGLQDYASQHLVCI